MKVLAKFLGSLLLVAGAGYFLLPLGVSGEVVTVLLAMVVGFWADFPASQPDNSEVSERRKLVAHLLAGVLCGLTLWLFLAVPPAVHGALDFVAIGLAWLLTFSGIFVVCRRIALGRHTTGWPG
jgi:hypothetical protein